MSKRNKAEKIWIIGEQLGENILNNGFYLWKKSIEESKKAYFVAAKSKKNMYIFEKLNKTEKQFWLWKDSDLHKITYKNADALFVTLSFRDVVPSNVELSDNTKPLIYLQHGILGIKRIGYKPQDYNGNLFRFLYYNKKLRNDLIKNNFEEYQLEHVEVPFRFQELIKQSENIVEEKGRCFVFITWRDYENNENTKLAHTIVNDIKELSKKNKAFRFRIMFHEQFKVNQSSFEKTLDDSEKIEIISISEHDIMEEINKSEVLITDYSSIVWDATYLEKKVVMYTPDLQQYLETRVLYQAMENKDYVALSLKELLVKFRTAAVVDDFNLYAQISKDDVKKGVHTKEFIDNISDQLKVTYTFIGYNFYGVGGTVNATKAHAYHLLKQKKRVELVSFNVTTKDNLILPGCQRKIIYRPQSLNRYIEPIGKIKPKQYFLYDDKFVRENNRFNQYSVLKLIYFLKNTEFDYIISTYETFHYYINKYAEGEKVYIYNTDYEYYENQFINKKKIIGVTPNKLEGTKVFVSESLKQSWEKKYGVLNNNELRVVGNQVAPRFDRKKNYIDRENNIYIEIRNSFIFENKIGYRGIIEFKFDEEKGFSNVIIKAIVGRSIVPIRLNLKETYSTFEFWCENGMFEDIKFEIELDDMKIVKSVSIERELPSRIENNMRLCYSQLSKSVWWEASEVVCVFNDLENHFHVKNVECNSYTMIEKENIRLVEINRDKKIYVLKWNEITLDFTHLQSGKEIALSGDQYLIYNNQFLIKKDEKIEVLTYFRISKDRKDYVDAIVECATYFKERQSNIRIKVAGRGDLTNYLLEKIVEHRLETFVEYIGFLSNTEKEIINSNFVVSFSKKESFGMAYIETIKNKTPIFTFANLGSRDIFGEKSYAIFEDYSELLDKIENFDKDAYDEITRNVTKKYVVENESNNLF